MEKRKIITKEKMKQILSAFYPGGYGIDNTIRDEDVSTWHIGWFGIQGRTELGLPLEINLDCGGSTITFSWWAEKTDYTNIELIAYIRGVISQLLPDICYDDDGTIQSVITFSFREEEEE